MGQTFDFPELTNFLDNLKIKKTLFGYDKDDVLAKMKQMDNIYKNKLKEMQEQINAERAELAQAEDELRVRIEMARAQANERLTEAEEDARSIRAQAESESSIMRSMAKAESEQTLKKAEEDAAATRAEAQKMLDETRDIFKTHVQTLGLLSDELGRVSGKIAEIQTHADDMKKNVDHLVSYIGDADKE